MGSFHYQIRNITLKHRIRTKHDIELVDIDYNEKYLAILCKEDKRVIEFYDLSAILSSTDFVDLKVPYFSIKFQRNIQDYFFNKNINLEILPYKNFLIVQTIDSLIIYRESEQKIMKKVFSLDVDTYSPKETRFKFIFDNPNKTEKTSDELVGCFYILQKNSLNIYYIRNLESQKQTIVSDMFKIALSHYKNNELISVKSDDLNTTEICTYSPNFIIAKYVVQSDDGRKTAKLDCFKLLMRAVDTNNFVYNHKNKHVYGNLKHKEMIFPALKAKYESKFFYKIVLHDKEHFFDCYWALINNSLFVKINVETKQIRLFKILHNQVDVIVVQKKPFDIMETLGNIVLVRFLLLNELMFLVIIENAESYTIVQFIIENETIAEMNQLFNISKQFLSDHEIVQYELVQTNKAKGTLKLFIADESNTIKAFTLCSQTSEVLLSGEASFKSRILEFYRNKKYPHTVIVLTNDSLLTFLDISLNFLADYDITCLGINVVSNANNFTMKHLYDNFFIVS